MFTLSTDGAPASLTGRAVLFTHVPFAITCEPTRSSLTSVILSPFLIVIELWRKRLPLIWTGLEALETLPHAPSNTLVIHLNPTPPTSFLTIFSLHLCCLFSRA